MYNPPVLKASYLPYIYIYMLPDVVSDEFGGVTREESLVRQKQHGEFTEKVATEGGDDFLL